MDNRMTVRMFQTVFGGLTPASQMFVSVILSLLDSEGMLKITAGDLGMVMYPDSDRGAVIQRVNRMRRILESELYAQGLLGILWVKTYQATPQSPSFTAYRFDLERFREMSEAAAAAAA